MISSFVLTSCICFLSAISKFEGHGAFFLQIALGEAVLIEEVTEDFG